MRTNKFKIIVLYTILIICIIILYNTNAIPQSQLYHSFADTHCYCSIPNSLNVISNLLFLVFGISGIILILQNKLQGLLLSIKLNYIIFFIGISLTGIGSAYYHLNPNHHTLVWDRMPMSISFMAFFSIIIAEYINEKVGKYVLFPLLTLGLSSVLYWQFTESIGQGDLRFYIFVQFLPMLLIPLIIIIFTSAFHSHKHIWLVLILYAFAKLFESLDVQIYNILHFVSGHTLKHIIASIAPYVFLMGLKNRTRSFSTTY